MSGILYFEPAFASTRNRRERRTGAAADALDDDPVFIHRGSVAGKGARLQRRLSPPLRCSVLLDDFDVTDLGAWREMPNLLVKLPHDAEVHHGKDGLDVC